MAIAYRAIGWNRQKRLYDLAIGGLLILGLAAYGATVFLFHPATTIETFIIRFAAIAALVLLHLVLAIGPLARIDRRFLPLLYNRRHLGVTTFILALIHGVFALVQFHAGGNLNPLVSVLTSYQRDYFSSFSEGIGVAHFPFEVFGLAALCVLFVMAATSHDFWLKNLGASFWKLIHMVVYLAYAFVLLHVFLGALQTERRWFFPAVLGAGFAGLIALHLTAFAKERRLDRMKRSAESDGFIPVATTAGLLSDVGKVVIADGNRIALFLHNGRIFALSNVCRHQGGPLGEGRIVAGCLTCPWHGYQYRVEDGRSPPPFTEVAPTYSVRVIAGTVYVSPAPLPFGRKSAGVPIDANLRTNASEFYIGWQPKMPRGLRRHTVGVSAVLSVAIPGLLMLAARLQNPVDPGTFEFGIERTFEGTLFESPLPLLHVHPPTTRSGMNFLLVGSGKFGPPAALRGKNGSRIRFNGSLVHRNGMAMIEVNQPETLEVIRTRSETLPLIISLGPATFAGELVDTKCFLGVMRPALGKIHRGCAIRCLSGGAPPGLLVRDDQGNGVLLILAGSQDKEFNIDSDLAARTLEVRGDLELHSGTPILRVRSWRVVDPAI